jgi:lysophospholipase L1-like esterase
VVLRVVVWLIVALLVAGCGEDEPDPGRAESGPADPERSLVALGDSIPLNEASTCPGCDGFVDTYADEIGADVVNLSVHGRRVQGVADQLAAGEASAVLADADVVIVSFGANDQPPYRGADQPCRTGRTATFVAAVEAVAATTTDCVDQVTRTIRRGASEALADIAEQAPDATVAVLAPYDFWLGWPELQAAPDEKVAAAEATIRYAVRRWRDALCGLATDQGMACVDLYAAFNGPDGDRPAGDLLSSDHTHPSQRGNDLIRDLLLEANLIPTNAS